MEIDGKKAMCQIVTKVICNWCGGAIRCYLSGSRPKASSRDNDSETIIKYDYHESCWNIAIEVQV